MAAYWLAIPPPTSGPPMLRRVTQFSHNLNHAGPRDFEKTGVGASTMAALGWNEILKSPETLPA
jgi:hypothetical protein